MKNTELIKKNKPELENMLLQEEEKLGEYRTKAINRQLPDITQIRKTREVIARIKTVLNNKNYISTDTQNN